MVSRAAMMAGEPIQCCDNLQFQSRNREPYGFKPAALKKRTAQRLKRFNLVIESLMVSSYHFPPYPTMNNIKVSIS